jgi:tetratricopeptide (TPR) repeat protein
MRISIALIVLICCQITLKAMAAQPNNAGGQAPPKAKPLHDDGYADRTNECSRLARQAAPLVAQQKYEEAKALYEQACKLDPNLNSGATHGAFGHMYQVMGKYNEAIAELQKALKFDATLPGATYNLGACYANTRQWDKAKIYFSKYVTDNPTGPLVAQAKSALERIETLRTAAANPRTYVQSNPPVGQPSDAYMERSNKASALIDKGNDFSEKKQIDEAKRAYEEACKLDPNSNSVVAHTNLGNLLNNAGDSAGSIEELNKALAIDPNYSLAIYDIACSYMMGGDVDKAKFYLNKYLQEHRGDPQTRAAEDLLAGLNLRQGKIGGIPDDSHHSLQGIDMEDLKAPDYFRSVTLQGQHIWPREKMPVRVHFASGADVKGYRPYFKQALIDSLNEWTKASENKFCWKRVSNEQDADLVCSWVSRREDLLGNERGAEQGLTRVKYSTDPHSDGRTLYVSIKICTMNITDGTPLDDKILYATCLHEVGHAIGMGGHSPCNRDIMTFVGDTENPHTQLTERDIATINHLYAGYPSMASK